MRAGAAIGAPVCSEKARGPASHFEPISRLPAACHTPNAPAIASASRMRVAFSKWPHTLLATLSAECPRCLEGQKIGRLVLDRAQGL